MLIKADHTQLTLGVDRNSEIAAYDFDERDPGVLEMRRMAVEGCKHNGICGQAPSDYHEMAEYLVGLGINSINLTPDTVMKPMQKLAEIEAKS